MYYRITLWLVVLTVLSAGGVRAADDTLTFKFQEGIDHGPGVYMDCNDVTINYPGTNPLDEFSPYMRMRTDYFSGREWYNTLIRFDHLAGYLPDQGLYLEVVEAYITLTFYNDGFFQESIAGVIDTHPVLKAWNGAFTDWNNATGSLAWEQSGAQGSSDRGEPHTSKNMGTRDNFIDPYKEGEKFDFALPAELVQSWLADPNNNRGIIMIMNHVAATSVQFYSSDFEGDPNNHPQLTIIAREIIPPCLPIPADIDGNCYVDLVDLWLLTDQWAQCTGGSADIYDKGDGCVDMFDYALFAGLWLTCSDPTNDRCTWPPVIECPHIPADINHDCYVNIIDLSLMKEQWLECTGGSADIYDKGDGCVDMFDYALFAGLWLACSDPTNDRCTWPPVVECPQIPADINHDCYVNIIDLSLMKEQWLQCTGGAADIYDDGGDGCVNLLDFARLASFWLQCSDYQDSRCTWGK